LSDIRFSDLVGFLSRGISLIEDLFLSKAGMQSAGFMLLTGGYEIGLAMLGMLDLVANCFLEASLFQFVG
jgi:hypothetical protein